MRKHTINLMRVVQIAKTIRYLGVYKKTVVENRFCDNCGKFYSAAFCPEVLTYFLLSNDTIYITLFVVNCVLLIYFCQLRKMVLNTHMRRITQNGTRNKVRIGQRHFSIIFSCTEKDSPLKSNPFNVYSMSQKHSVRIRYFGVTLTKSRANCTTQVRLFSYVLRLFIHPNIT